MEYIGRIRRNELSLEVSPYLQQHADNPVHWQAWSEIALQHAQKEDKPILVSIGYSTCHWCHVMEHESFEDEEVAQFMNAHFICIKIDREERPDLDQIYMDACQIMTGQGGWPLNCFLNTKGHPFYAGTYFPPKPLYQRPSWMEVLTNIHRAWLTQRDVVEDQAQKLLQYIRNGDSVLFAQSKTNKPGIHLDVEAPYQADLQFPHKVFESLKSRFDRHEGGFGHAPKFPQFMALQYLLEYAHYNQNEEALLHTVFSLERYITGGIYDHLAGGMFRYSVDSAWSVPHFEKMLYDNALFCNILAQTIQKLETSALLKGHDAAAFEPSLKLFKNALADTCDFFLTHLKPQGAPFFFSALDADTDGHEGRFYTWSKQEIMEALGQYDGTLWCDYFDVTESGNWEDTNVLKRVYSDAQFAAKHADGAQWIRENLPKAILVLRSLRAQRTAPELDDNQILGWNAMMVSGLVRASVALQSSAYLEQAETVLAALLSNFESGSGIFAHTWRGAPGPNEAFLDDYALLIAACIDVFEVNSNLALLKRAQALLLTVERHFDQDGIFFYYSSEHQNDLIVRKTDYYDAALPSGNSTMLHNLQRMAHLFGNAEWAQRAERILLEIKPLVQKNPLSFGHWAVAIQRHLVGYSEVVVTGSNAHAMGHALHTLYLPNAIKAIQVNKEHALPLWEHRGENMHTQIYLCQKMVCTQPVDSVAAFLKNWFGERLLES